MNQKRAFEYGGYLAGAVLIVFGVVAIYMGVSGWNEVRDRLADQKITGTPDAAEITNGALEDGEAVDTGAKAKGFADIMEFHALEATGGKRYSEMGRFLTEAGEETNDEAEAAKTPEGRPVENGARNLWVTQTALATALNMLHGRAALHLRHRRRRRAAARRDRVHRAVADRRAALGIAGGGVSAQPQPEVGL